ncbi:murein hydrolase activator EnvC family protein [Alkalibacterium sp. MB6]|uniref:murein hydrolase activator EnvC family protein n=1 Tax=Alkalibacterium sp. MB6 TaxID=2081965 RepID=UPI00137A149E|nr:M23 family metallopeptidase [Alkalibacterium sp. MB6]
MNKKRLFAILATAMLAAPIVGNNEADASSSRMRELEQQQQELNNRSKDVNHNIKTREERMNALNEEKAQLEKEVATLQGNIDQLINNISEKEAEIVRIEQEIARLQEEIAQLIHQIEQRNEQLERQARSVQKNGQPGDFIDIILSAEDLSDLIGRIGVINQLVSANQNIVQAQMEDQLALEAAEEQVKAEEEEAKSIKAQLEVDRNNLVAQRMELDDKIIQVAERFEMTAKERESFINEQTVIAQRTSNLSKEMQKEQQRIIEEARRRAEEERIAEEKRAREAEAAAAAKAQAEAAAARKKAQAASKPSTPATSSGSSSSSSAPSSTGWIRPSGGRLTSGFGNRTHPVYGGTRLHAGVDFGGGGPIRASRAGTVRTASYDGGLGYHVVIDHGDGYSSVYAHMTPGLTVAPGQQVSQGQQLGTMGTTGTSTGVHLHFEIHRNGTPVNPMSYLR